MILREEWNVDELEGVCHVKSIYYGFNAGLGIQMSSVLADSCFSLLSASILTA